MIDNEEISGSEDVEEGNNSNGKRKRKIVNKQKNNHQEHNKIRRVRGLDYISASGQKLYPISRTKEPFKIMKYVLIKCDRSGGVSCSRSYAENFELFRFWKQGVHEFQTICTAKCPRPEVNQKKVGDVGNESFQIFERRRCRLHQISNIDLAGH
jgi:hypothetical protein